MHTIPLNLPAGFTVVTSGRFNSVGDCRTEYRVVENGREQVTVTTFQDAESLTPEVSWPSTSDKRPELAQALAYTLAYALAQTDELR